MRPSAKERMYELKRTNARKQTRPMFPSGWGKDEAEALQKEQRGGPTYDFATEQELAAQMVQLNRARIMHSPVGCRRYAALERR
jgi:hypothetical protein